MARSCGRFWREWIVQECYNTTMIPKLTEEMLEALQDPTHRPVQVEDERTRSRYVLVPFEIYQRIRSLFADDEFDIAETYTAQDDALAEVWNDPDLDVYNDYDAHKPQP